MSCRTALQAYAIDVIHSLVEEQISPVLVRLATTGPQVSFCICHPQQTEPAKA